MAKLIFLGTGPVGGVSGKGKTKRFETSTLIKTKRGSILIDVSEDFKKQAKLIDHIDAILITHGHRDAIGGITQLRIWLNSQLRNQKSQPAAGQPKAGKFKTQNPSKIPLYSLPATIGHIKRKTKQLDFLEFYPIKSFKSFRLFGINPVRKGFSNGVKITPFKVRHSIQKGFPTLGFKFYFPNTRPDRRKSRQEFLLTYISDTGGWSKKVQNLIKGSDLLVLDGAMWGKKLVAHLDMKEITPKAKKWGVKKLIFTQIGKTAPPYKILKKELAKLWPKAIPAYDRMKIQL